MVGSGTEGNRHVGAPAMVFAGLSLDRLRIMGVVNVTPDSFSDGGDAFETDAAIERGLRLAADGADIIDVGGESTRPGAVPVPERVETDRVLPVIGALAKQGLLVSVDTRHAGVMARALDAGAAIVNDVSALTNDPESLPLVATSGCSVVLMHMRGDPRTMQIDPHYGDVAREVRDWLVRRVVICRDAGIDGHRIAVDPGIGFGKTVDHNLSILARLDLYENMDVALLVGASRKSFIARLSREEPVGDRLGGSIAAALAAIERGAHIVRVHDVAITRQALDIWRAIAAAGANRG